MKILAALFLVGLAVVSSRGAEVRIEQYGLTLIGEPPVQDELHLSRSVRSLIDREFRAYVAATQKLFPAGSLPEARRQKMGDLRKLQDGVANRVLRALTDQQTARFRQIVLQRQGVWAVLIPEVSRKLQITATQRGKIRACQSAFGKRIKDLQDRRQKEVAAIAAPADPKDRKAVGVYQAKVRNYVERASSEDRASVLAWGRKAMADATAVLTTKQKTEWQAMLGPKFAPAGSPRRAIR